MGKAVTDSGGESGQTRSGSSVVVTESEADNLGETVIQEADGSRQAPRVWALVGYRAGEAAQIRALAKALGWPFAAKRLMYRRLGVIGDLLRSTTLSGIDRHRSSPLEPPWPDLVISAGLRNEPVCRWIRKASGGRTKVVKLGRTWASTDCFDLVVTTPQYRVPPHPKVLQNSTTMHEVTPEHLQAAAAFWAPQLEHLPAPLIAVVVGGDSGPFSFGVEAGRRLARQACELARRRGGSLLVTTSSRTRRAAAEALLASIDVPAESFVWKARAGENPYFGFLSLADEIVVTGDSIAMLSEACATGKPVHIFDLGEGALSMRRNEVATAGFRAWRAQEEFRWSAFLYAQLMRIGPRRLSRDIGLVHEQLVESGRATWLGDTPPDRMPPPSTDIPRTVARVKALLEEDAGIA